MPSLGADMEAGTLVEWLKAPGDAVARGDIIAVIETQKGAIEIEVFEDGVLKEYLARIGDTVPVGTPLAMISGAGDDTVPAPATPVPPVPPKTPKPAAPVRVETPGGARLKITPAARRLAAQHKIDLSAIKAPAGQEIRLADIAALVKRPAPESAGSAMRDAIAAAMSRSKREIPHYYLSQSVDITAAESFVAEVNKDRPATERLLLGAVLVKAVATALRKYPEFNGHYEDAGFVPSKAAHVGMAINLRGGGLVAPALHDAESKSLDDLMAGLRDLVARVRAGRFRARELSDPTITISSLGDRGVDQLYGVIYPPQVAILGFGTPRDRPWVQDGQIAVRRIVSMTLSADHRVSDGLRGAKFMTAIDRQLQNPGDL